MHFASPPGLRATACIEGMHVKHGKPMTTAAVTATDNPRGLGPVASVAERLVVASKPGNSGGAKGLTSGTWWKGQRDCDWLRPSNTKEPERPGSDCMVGRRLRRWCDRGPAVKPVGEPDAGNPPVRFDEREVETEHGRRLLRHKPGKPRNRICRNLPHRATSRLYPYLPQRLNLPIGSGVTEAACKTIVTQRLKLSGMRWIKQGAQTILNLRVVLLSGIWQPLYRTYLENHRVHDLRTYGQLPKMTARQAA